MDSDHQQQCHRSICQNESRRIGLDPVLFGLSDEDYELLAKNFAQIRSTLKQTQDILDRYKEYYEGTTKTNN
jgi:hypothetical protein